MAGLIDADCVVVRLVWIAGLLVWRDVVSYLAEFEGGREWSLVIRGSRV